MVMAIVIGLVNELWRHAEGSRIPIRAIHRRRVGELKQLVVCVQAFALRGAFDRLQDEYKGLL
jgi:hypothetical protein